VRRSETQSIGGFFYTFFFMRDSMLIYRSFYEAIKELPLEEQGQVWNAIYELGLNGVEVCPPGIPGTIFKLIKPQIEANLKRFQNGKSSKYKQSESKTQANEEQSESKQEANNNNNVNVNKNNILLRNKAFYDSLVPYVKDYPKEMLREFFEYWTEIGEHDKKMRFEKEKTWGLSRRLSTWHKRSLSYKGGNCSKPLYFDGSDKLVAYINNQIKPQ
jgi:hypothetical protein